MKDIPVTPSVLHCAQHRARNLNQAFIQGEIYEAAIAKREARAAKRIKRSKPKQEDSST